MPPRRLMMTAALDEENDMHVRHRTSPTREPLAPWGWGRFAPNLISGTIYGKRPALDVHIRAQRIILNEFAARFDQIAHQLGEDVVGLVDLLDPHLHNPSFVGVARG